MINLLIPTNCGHRIYMRFPLRLKKTIQQKWSKFYSPLQGPLRGCRSSWRSPNLTPRRRAYGSRRRRLCSPAQPLRPISWCPVGSLLSLSSNLKDARRPLIQQKRQGNMVKQNIKPCLFSQFRVHLSCENVTTTCCHKIVVLKPGVRNRTLWSAVVSFIYWLSKKHCPVKLSLRKYLSSKRTQNMPVFVWNLYLSAEA